MLSSVLLDRRKYIHLVHSLDIRAICLEINAILRFILNYELNNPN